MKLSFCAGVIVDDQVYFSNNLFNGLFKSAIDSDINTAQFIGKFNGEGADVRLLHKKAIKYGDSIVFLPNRGSNIHVYNIKDNTISSYFIEKRGNTAYAFADGIVIEDKLYIMPGNLLQPIAVMDLIDYSIETIDTHLVDLVNLSDRIPSGQFFWKAIEIDKKIYMAIMSTNSIISFDIEKKEFDVIKLGGSYLYNSLYKNGDEVLISTVCGGICSWDSKTKSIQEIVGDKDGSNMVYFINEYTNNKCFLIPDLGGDVYYLFHNEGIFSIEKCQINLHSIQGDRETGYLYEFGTSWDKGVIIFPGYNFDMYYLSDNGSFTKEIICENNNEINELVKKGLCNEISVEGRPFTLKEYLDVVAV